MRITFSSSNTKILPSPILPVFADFSIASITCSSISDLTAASIFTLGRKSTTYSAPRYSSVCPFWRPKPLPSVTVIPCTPMPESASRTSSSLNGLMIAVTSFMKLLPDCVGLSPKGSELVKDLDSVGRQVLAEVGVVGEHLLIARVSTDFAAHFVVVGCKVRHGQRVFLVFRPGGRAARHAEAQAILVVERLGAQRALQFRHERVRGVKSEPAVLALRRRAGGIEYRVLLLDPQ